MFSITQLLTVFHWGALSDRIGRKPVLIMVSHTCQLDSIFIPGMRRLFHISNRIWL